MASDYIKLDLNILKNAKICTEKCDHKHDDGTLEILGKSSVISCVGCGQKCHMQCMKVPKSMMDAVNMVPKNNRHFAFYGQMAYTRIVCDNCANLLNENVSNDSPPTFKSLFEKIATRVLNEKINELMNSMKTNEQNAGTSAKVTNQNASKRSKPDYHENDGNESRDMMESMIQSLINTVSELSSNLNMHHVRSNEQLNGLGNVINNIGSNLNTQIASMEKKLTENINDVADNVKVCSTKLDKNENYIESGFQTGFNNLMENAQQWMTPANTPKRSDNQYRSLRRNAMESNMRFGKDATPRPRRSSFRNGPKLPTEEGSNENNDIFGPAVSRRIDFDTANKETETVRKQTQPQFKHENAIFVRYVDPSVTVAKMFDIVKMNETLNEALNTDPGAIEINRLVKKTLTDEQIAGFKNGISFRIGCADSLYGALQSKSNWATHWQIRPWAREYKATEAGKDYTNGNDLNSEEMELGKSNRK